MEQQILIGLLVGIICLIFMIIKTKIHTFLALIVATIIVGIVGGMEYPQIYLVVSQKGFWWNFRKYWNHNRFLEFMMGQLF